MHHPVLDQGDAIVTAELTQVAECVGVSCRVQQGLVLDGPFRVA